MISLATEKTLDTSQLPSESSEDDASELAGGSDLDSEDELELMKLSKVKEKKGTRTATTTSDKKECLLS